MSEVPEVIRQLLCRTLDIRCVTALDLRPACDPRLDEVPARPERHGLLELCEKLGPLGAGPDDRHVALEDVPELRELVDPRPPQEPADACRPGIALLGPGRAPFLRVRAHR